MELSHCLLLTGSSDRTIRVWSTENGACLQVITEHNATTKVRLHTLIKLHLLVRGVVYVWTLSAQRSVMVMIILPPYDNFGGNFLK